MVAAVLIALAVSITPFVLGTKAQQANDTAATAQNQLGPAQQKANLGDNLANKISVACNNKAILTQLQQIGACQAANAIHQVVVPIPGTPGQNGQPGANGQNGQPGRGITNTFIAGGHLNIIYTDGTTKDVGVVVGANGNNGTNGKDGQDGRGIISTALGGTTGTDLIVNYSDNTSTDVGNVVGPKGTDGSNGSNGANGNDGANGKDGTNGADGRGVQSVSVDSNFHLIVTYTDGSTGDAGMLPAGPQGIGVQSVALDNGGPTGCEFVFTLENPKDGTSSTQDVAANPAVCPPVAPPPTTTDTPPSSGPGG